MTFTSEQKAQVDRQLQQHESGSFTLDLAITSGHVLQDYKIGKGVFRPDITSAIFFARWLFFNNGLYQGKEVIEIGCGSGLQSVVMGLYGAKHVTASDISNAAVQNTQENFDRYGIEGMVVQGDLFESINSRADVIVFNHPFFAGEPYEDVPLSRSMLGGEVLLSRFLREANEFLSSDGIVISPYWNFAGETNDPSLRGPEAGYVVEMPFSMKVNVGLQQGNFSIYVLHRKY